MWARTSAMQSGSGISQPYEKPSFSELSHGAVRSYLPELLALKDNVDDFFFSKLIPLYEVCRML